MESSWSLKVDYGRLSSERKKVGRLGSHEDVGTVKLQGW